MTRKKTVPVGQLLEFDPPFPKQELTNCVFGILKDLFIFPREILFKFIFYL